MQPQNAVSCGQILTLAGQRLQQYAALAAGDLGKQQLKLAILGLVVAAQPAVYVAIYCLQRGSAIAVTNAWIPAGSRAFEPERPILVTPQGGIEYERR